MSFITDLLSLFGLIAATPPPLESMNTAYAGMDISAYPGDNFMKYMQAISNIKWTNAYLTAPGHLDATWETPGAAKALLLGLGVLPTYLGHQDNVVTNKPRITDTGIQVPAIGTTEGKDAVAQAAIMGLPDHAMIFLDWESWGEIEADGLTYCIAWFTAVAESGFRPGLYAHTLYSTELRKLWPDLLVWIPASGLKFDEAFTIASTSVKINARDPRTNRDKRKLRDPDAVAWQMYYLDAGNTDPAKDWPVTAKFPLQGGSTSYPALSGGLGSFTSGGRPRFDLDVSSSCMIDPRFPETTVSPGLVRGGRAGAAAASDTALLAFRVCAGVLDVYQGSGDPRTWAVQPVESRNNAPPLAFHPWLPPRAVRRLTAVDLAAVARSRQLGTSEDEWKLHVYRKRGQTWTTDDAVSGAQLVAPLLGVKLLSRAADTLEAVFQGQDHRLYIVVTTDAVQQVNNQAWTAPAAIPAPANFAPSRVGGIGAVSRAAGLADYFVVGQTTADPVWRIYWIASPSANHQGVQFTNQFAVPLSPDPFTAIHPFSNIAAVARGALVMDAFVIGKRLGDADWKLYRWYWDSNAGNWGTAAAPHLDQIGGAAVLPHPVSRIAAVSYQVQGVWHIDVFAVGNADGFLYYTRWDGIAWSGFARIGAGAVTVAAVEEAVLRSSTAIEVVATGRDGNVYVATSTAALAGYGALTRVTELDPGAI